ncbi:unnamed protein product [Rotaria sp. Silwood1]|nr:unnamed protein product [Rotaria sp. Silwood1]CAF4757825.1 unnamed protein product [Rotaria sp. Silwood1]CAF4868612.1 unnamed protein product [Rotaria sp. Silwood1]
MNVSKNAASLPIFTEAELSMNKRFKLISWNIDGLDRLQHTLEERTRGVVAVIQREKPDAVFLQEVIPESLFLLNNSLSEYDFYTGYFVAILTRRDILKVQSHEVIPYPGTQMDRNLLIVHVIYEGSIEIDLMTSHHESCQPGADERIRQLKLCFKKMVETPANRIVLFGGDLNMRDNELVKAGDIPAGICDLWIEMGKHQEYAYTWDMQRNTNLDFSANNFQPRCRFDRLYFRAATSPMVKFKPVAFKLEGLEIIQSIQRFCSDHWAIQAEFEV